MHTSYESSGLSGLLIGKREHANRLVVILHGYAMCPEDLEPFANSLGIPALFCFPRAPFSAAPGGFSWWDLDETRRLRQIAAGPRDLVNEYPDGRPAARDQLLSFISALRAHVSASSTVIGGFSQGGMLACDTVLCGHLEVDALLLLSSSRIAISDWNTHLDTLAGLPVMIAHGHHDTDLAFSAGEALRDFHHTCGAQVTWVPFNGAHEIPLVVWRSVRKFLQQLYSR